MIIGILGPKYITYAHDLQVEHILSLLFLILCHIFTKIKVSDRLVDWFSQHMLAASSLKRNPTLSSATKKKVEEENILKVELLLYVGQRSKKAVSSKQRVNYNVIIGGGTVTYPITYPFGFSIEKFWWDSVQILIHRLGIGPGPWRWAWWLLHLTHNPTLLLCFFHLRVTHLVLHLSPTSLINTNPSHSCIMHGNF